MRLVNIDDQTLDSFVAANDKSHFMQTSAWGKVAASRGQQIHQLGLYDGETLKATALLLEKKILCYSSFYCPRGFILDYSDREVLKEMIREVKDYVKKHRGLYFRIDPDLIWHKLDEKAQPIESFPENEKIITFLQEQGAVWKGKTIRFQEMSNPRFTFRVPLENDLLAQCHPTTRNIINKGNPYGIRVYKGDEKDIDKFYGVMSETARNKSIYLEPRSFFADFYTILAKEDKADIWVAEIDIPQLKDYYSSKEDALKADLALAESPDASKKQRSKRNDILDQLKKIEKEKKELEEIPEETVVLSSVINARFKDKVWIVHGGNSDRLRSLQGNYELYYRVLEDAKENGLKWGDLFGTEGKVDKSSDVYGIFLFKLRFGGDFDEFIGEFDFETRPLTSHLINKLLHWRRRLLIRRSVKENRK